MATTAAGCTRATAPRTISAVSMPVVPKTPEARAHTGRMDPNSPGMALIRWRVMIRCSSASGPSASGVMARLPSPTASTAPFPGSMDRSCWASAMAAR